jgi:hypothetical protein
MNKRQKPNVASLLAALLYLLGLAVVLGCLATGVLVGLGLLR